MARLRNRYGVLGSVHMAMWLIRSKCICGTIRIIRFPFALFGKKYIDFGQRLSVGRNCRIEAYSLDGTKDKRLVFGNDVQLNDSVHIVAMGRVQVGNNVLVASHVFISDNSHGCYKGLVDDSNPDIPPMERDYYIKPIEIGENVWIGEGAVILLGVTIGRGSIIGAHSLVNKDVPPYCIVVGNPARVVKRYDFDKCCWMRV